MSHEVGLAPVSGIFSPGANQITEIDISTLTPPATGEWKVIITQGATVNEYIVSHTNNNVEDDLLAFEAAEFVNILNDTGFIVTFTGVLNSGKLIFEGADTLTSAVFTTVDISSNVSTTIFNTQTGVVAGQPQVTDVSYWALSAPSATSDVAITIGAATNTYPLNFGDIDTSLPSFVSTWSAAILGIHNIVVTYEGIDPAHPLGATNSGILRFTGGDPTVVFAATAINIVGNVLSSSSSQASIPPSSKQLTYVGVSTLTPPITGSWKLVITQGVVVNEYIVNHTTGNAFADLTIFKRANQGDIFNKTGFFIGAFGSTNSGIIWLRGSSSSVSGVVTTIVVSGNSVLDITDVQANAPDSSIPSLSYNIKNLIYGERTPLGDFFYILNNRKSVERVETTNFIDIINLEFTNSIVVTKESGVVSHISGNRVVSLTEDGTGSIIEYNLFGSTTRRFKVIENIALLELAIDAL